MGKFIDLTGKKISKWTIKSFSHKENKAIYWNCICECGTERKVDGSSIKRLKSTSCGCQHKTILTDNTFALKNKGESGFNTLYSGYRGGARRRGLEFLLTKDEFAKLTKDACFYCRSLPSSSIVNYGPHMKDRNIEHSKYIFNGIDRIDSSIGYIHGNVVTCCKTCNLMKGTLSKRDFIEQCKKISTSHTFE